MNAFQWPADDIALVIAIAAAVLTAGIFALPWLRQRRRADREAARAEAALADVRNLASERARLTATSTGLADQVAALRASIDQAERNPLRPAALYLRNRVAELAALVERGEAALAAERHAFAAGVDAAAASNGSYRSRRAVDANLDGQRRTIAEWASLRERLRAQAERTEAFADDLSRDAFEVARWRREVDLAIGSAERPAAAPYHAPGWPDFVSTVRREYPPEEPASAAAPEPR